MSFLVLKNVHFDTEFFIFGGEKAKIIGYGVVTLAILKARVFIRYETRSHLCLRINRFVLPLGTFMQKWTFGLYLEVN